jgi:hypothetical protein
MPCWMLRSTAVLHATVHRIAISLVVRLDDELHDETYPRHGSMLVPSTALLHLQLFAECHRWRVERESHIFACQLHLFAHRCVSWIPHYIHPGFHLTLSLCPLQYVLPPGATHAWQSKARISSLQFSLARHAFRHIKLLALWVNQAIPWKSASVLAIARL